MTVMAICTPELAHNHLLCIWPEPLDFRDLVMVLFLDRNHYIIGNEQLFTGGRTECTIDCYVPFTKALQFGAKAILMAHNHPSGNVVSSRNDEANAKKVEEAGRILKIEVAQMIISRSDFYVISFF